MYTDQTMEFHKEGCEQGAKTEPDKANEAFVTGSYSAMNAPCEWTVVAHFLKQGRHNYQLTQLFSLLPDQFKKITLIHALNISLGAIWGLVINTCTCFAYFVGCNLSILQLI